MSESKARQVIAALELQLRNSIVADGGVTYWLTPDVVAQVPGFSEEALQAAAAKTTIITLSPDAPDQLEGLTFTTMKAQVLVHLAAATKFNTVQQSVIAPVAVHREVLQDRLLQDLEKAVGSSNTLGGLCLWARVVDRDKSAQRTYAEGWAVAYATVLIEYAYTEGQP